MQAIRAGAALAASRGVRGMSGANFFVLAARQRPSFAKFPRLKQARGTARRRSATSPFVHAGLCGPAWRLSARRRGDFRPRGRNFRVPTGPEPGPRSGRLSPAFVDTASSHSRQTLVVGPDGCPAPPGGVLCESTPAGAGPIPRNGATGSHPQRDRAREA